jgi:pimeloyl-ACP methyl ester carboxylesterase
MEAKGIASEPTARNRASSTIQSARKAPVRVMPWHLNVWLRRAVALTGGLLVLLGLSALAGSAYEVWASARERRLYPPPGRLVDLGGYRLHLYCTGQGSPTAVLEAGFGDSSPYWFAVQPEISKYTRVCAYDRAGYGWSERSPRPRATSVLAEELHSLLHRGGIAAPYILVGHSWGGLTVRVFANRYSSEVAGIVLVDASHPDARQFRHRPALPPGYRPRALRLKLKALSAFVGLPRLMGWCGYGPPQIRRLTRALECRPQFFETVRAETIAHPESLVEVRQSASLGDLPLVVISRDFRLSDPAGLLGRLRIAVACRVWEPMREEWTQLFNSGGSAASRTSCSPEEAGSRVTDEARGKMQEDLARLSTHSSLLVSQGSGHYILFDRPDDIVNAVQGVVQEWRAHTASRP